MVGRLSLAVCAALIASIPVSVNAQTKPAVPLPGGVGKMGTPYVLGKKGEELVFTLEKAEFASRALMKDTALFPNDGERLVVFTYAVQNPGTADRFFFNQSFAFTVVSPDDENYLCDGAAPNGLAGYHPDRRDRLAMQLKPAQKVRALAVVQIHPKGPVNKLIVQRGKGTAVVRYDLKALVKLMTGAYASNGGLDMRDVGASNLTVPFQIGTWDMVVESMEDIPGAIGAFEPDSGEKWVVLSIILTNAGYSPTPLNHSIVTGKMFDVDGSQISTSWSILKNSAPESLSGTVEPGASLKLRMLFKASLAQKAERVVFKEVHSGRSVDVKLEKPKGL